MKIAVSMPVRPDVAAVLANDAEQASMVLNEVEQSMDRAAADRGRRRRGHARLVGSTEGVFGLVTLRFEAKTEALR